jgi:hypothetical protein
MRLWFSGPRIFGIRTGISLGPQDFKPTPRRARQNEKTGIAQKIGQNDAIFDPDHSFIYVIKNQTGRVKIGRAADCKQRLADLQTGNPEKLSFAWIGAPRADTVSIETDAHTMLGG